MGVQQAEGHSEGLPECSHSRTTGAKMLPAPPVPPDRVTETPQREKGGRDPLSRACWELGTADLETIWGLEEQVEGSAVYLKSSRAPRRAPRGTRRTRAAFRHGLLCCRGGRAAGCWCAQEGCQRETGATSQSTGGLAVGSCPLSHSWEGPG